MNLVAAAILLGSGWLAAGEERRFESLAAAEIATKLQNLRGQVSVNVRPNGLAGLWGDLTSATITANDFTLDELPLFTEPDRSTAGALGLLSLRLTDFTLRRLRVAELSADIPNCRYDFGLAKGQHKIRLSRSGVGRGFVKIREGDLAEYLVAKFHEIKRCTVKVDRGVVWVEGYGEFLIFKSDFQVIANLVPVGGDKLALADAKVYFDWRRADKAAADAILKTLNPVVDLNEDLGLCGAVSVDRVTLHGGILTAEGDTKIPIRPTENLH